MENRQESTERLYGRLVRRILERSAGEGVEKLPELGEWLRRQEWSIATLRLYRMALLWYFVDVGGQGSREEVGALLGLQGAVRKKRRGGPGKRRKSDKGWEPVKAWLEGRSSLADGKGRDVSLWMEAAMLAGYRPVEWWGCRVDLGQRRLWIPTAKSKVDAEGYRLRGAGLADASGVVWRYLDFVSEEDWAVVESAIRLRDRCAVNEMTAEEVLAGYAVWLRRGWDAVHKSVRPRITLYSGRHIFAGRMKKAGVDRKTLAAALGQISTKSSKVYGRANHAGGLRPGVVVPECVRETVRGPADGSPANGVGFAGVKGFVPNGPANNKGL